MAKVKTPKEVEPYWTNMVEIYFKFCRDNLQDSPTFDNSAPRDLKSIVKALRERSVKANIEWTIDVAGDRFYRFLTFAFQDKWLRENWLLFNINRQKDKIFYNIRKSINRTPVDPFE